MFETALKAHLPMVQVSTDDPVNFVEVLKYTLQMQGMPNKNIMEYKNPNVLGNMVYWTTDPQWATTATYQKFLQNEVTLVFLNVPERLTMAFDVGHLPIPDGLLMKYMVDAIGDDPLTYKLHPILRGLSLKAVREILMLTEARTGGLKEHDVRRTRSMVSESEQGLNLMDPTADFYVMPEQIKNWLTLNGKYFLSSENPKLIPRGLLFDGPPGVGKTMAAKAIANALQVPLYRLDIAGTLDRYIGVSESRLAKSLSLVDRESPCVLLIDEVEKTFAKQGESDTGVTTRMLSQLLWWLAEHQSRVFTVMTTNNANALPQELYRSGRVDRVIVMKPMETEEAMEFGRSVLMSVLGSVTPTQLSTVVKELQGFITGYGAKTHAQVTAMVYEIVKQNGWGLP